jgi:hypothetical protein
MMTDRTTSLPLRVSTDTTSGPYIRLPYNQIDEVRRLLESHGFRYWVEENIISLNGGPFMAVVNLGREVDTNAVQAILDSVR